MINTFTGIAVQNAFAILYSYSITNRGEPEQHVMAIHWLAQSSQCFVIMFFF